MIIEGQVDSKDCIHSVSLREGVALLADTSSVYTWDLNKSGKPRVQAFRDPDHVDWVCLSPANNVFDLLSCIWSKNQPYRFGMIPSQGSETEFRPTYQGHRLLSKEQTADGRSRFALSDQDD